MDNLLKNIEELRVRIAVTRKVLNLDAKEEQLQELKARMNLSSFWDDREEAVRVSKEVEELNVEIETWRELKSEVASLAELIAMVVTENDSALEADVNEQYDVLLKKFEKLEFLVLFSGEHDANNAIVSIHAGTGGVEAQDWAEMLERMILRFAEKRGWRVETVDRIIANEAGIKSASYHIAGRFAYGYLKSESGVHRLVRISPFDAESMRHTSFALIEVIPELPETVEIEIRDEDLKVDTFRSSGAGGQNVNKTESAIRITHVPSGIIVACQTERSQHQNRERAMNILRSKLFQRQTDDRKREESKLRGDTQKAEWGKQARSYVMQPYQMVKDHRTSHETSDVRGVLDGDLEEFMEAYLRSMKK